MPLAAGSHQEVLRLLVEVKIVGATRLPITREAALRDGLYRVLRDSVFCGDDSVGIDRPSIAQYGYTRTLTICTEGHKICENDEDAGICLLCSPQVCNECGRPLFSWEQIGGDEDMVWRHYDCAGQPSEIPPGLSSTRSYIEGIDGYYEQDNDDDDYDDDDD